jgi:hypothetical protein
MPIGALADRLSRTPRPPRRSGSAPRPPRRARSAVHHDHLVGSAMDRVGSAPPRARWAPAGSGQLGHQVKGWTRLRRSPRKRGPVVAHHDHQDDHRHGFARGALWRVGATSGRGRPRRSPTGPRRACTRCRRHVPALKKGRSATRCPRQGRYSAGPHEGAPRHHPHLEDRLQRTGGPRRRVPAGRGDCGCESRNAGAGAGVEAVSYRSRAKARAHLCKPCGFACDHLEDQRAARHFHRKLRRKSPTTTTSVTSSAWTA